MSSLFVQIVSNLVEYWILILTMQYVCAARMDLCRRNTVIGSCISVLSTVIVSLCPFSGETPAGLVAEIFFGMVAGIFLSVLLFSKRRLTDLMRFFPAFSIYFFLDVVPEALMEEFLPEAMIRPIFSDTRLTALYILSDGMLLILLLILRRVQIKYRVRIYFTAKEILCSIALLFFSFIDGTFIVMLNRINYTPIFYYLLAVIFAGGYALGVGYFLYSLIESRARIYRQTVARCETEYLRLQLNSLREEKEDEAEVKKMRHDLNKHLAVISSLCAEGNYEEVRKYAEQLSHGVMRSDSRILTGNQVADLVVASKRRACEEYGIEFVFAGTMNNLNAMAAPDICGLLANAYDNAIEACLVQPKGYIRTEVRTTRNYTVIEIVNSVEKKVAVRGNSVATTKKDRKTHGYGIEIMKQIAQRYSGSCTIGCDGKEFRLKIVLLT